jgi:hypothetical protein
MDGVLDALKHFCLLCVRKRGGDSNSANFYLTMFLYKNTILNVKKKIKKFIKKTVVYNEDKLFITNKP